MSLRVKKLYPDSKLPERANPGDSGADVFIHSFAAMYCESSQSINFSDKISPDVKSVVLKTNDRVLVNTGLSVAVDPGTEVQVRARSGNALKRGLIVVNGPGTIDSAYRGQVGVIIANVSHDSQKLCVGDKIAQLVVCPVILCPIEEVQDLDATDRGAGGFGSTDAKN